MNKIDRRVVKTLRLIDQTCYDLLATTAFERLSIAEICQEAEIGRSTFYQYYLDKYDWLEKQVARYTASFQELMNQRQLDFQETSSLTQLVKGLLPEQRRLQILLAIHVDSADLTQNFQRILQTALPQYLEQRSVVMPVPLAYLQEIYAASAMTYIRYAIENGLDERISSFMNQSFKVVLAGLTKPK